MIATAVGILTASMLGSVHCAGMCGPFVCFYAGGPAKPVPLRSHAWYNIGRLLSYSLLGATAGAIGMGVTHAAALAGVANGAAIVAGSMMILWGIIRIAELQGVHITLPLPSVQGPAQRVLGSALLYVKAQPINVRAAITGFVTTLLPCGWLYVFVAAAAGTGNIWSGMLLMFVFWLGNVPALVAVGIGAQRAFGPLQRRLPVLSAVMVTMLGIFAVFGHMTFAFGGVHHAH